MLRRRKRRYDRALRSGKQEHKEAYKQLQKEVEEEIRVAYYRYVDNLFDESSSQKNLWTFIKSKRWDQVGNPALMYNDRLVTTAKEKADALVEQ